MNLEEETNALTPPQPQHEGLKSTLELLEGLHEPDPLYKNYKEYVYFDFQALDFGFDWNETEEGYKYWRGIYISMLEEHFPSKSWVLSEHQNLYSQAFTASLSEDYRAREKGLRFMKYLEAIEDERARLQRTISSLIQENRNLKELLD